MRVCIYIYSRYTCGYISAGSSPCSTAFPMSWSMTWATQRGDRALAAFQISSNGIWTLGALGVSLDWFKEKNAGTPHI